MIATGEQHSVREFVTLAAEMLGLKLGWQGHGVDEKALDENGNVVVAVDAAYFRPTEVETLLGDATRARVELGWTPRTSFSELVREMVDSDLDSAERDALVRKHGYNAYNVRET